MNDSEIRAMVSYVVNYLNNTYPDHLETMIHFIGHVEQYRKRASEITEEIINCHDKLFVSCGSGQKIEEITQKFAEECVLIRAKMRKLVDEYVSEHPEPVF